MYSLSYNEYIVQKRIAYYDNMPIKISSFCVVIIYKIIGYFSILSIFNLFWLENILCIS